MLQVNNLHVRYGQIRAVKGIDLEVNAGEILALIGANGSGKTTTVNAIAGLLPFEGTIEYDGVQLRPMSAERNVRKGLALVPEGRGILGRMSVRENLLMGTYARSDGSAAEREIGEMMERFPVLRERAESPAYLLSGGEQQMLAIARALLSKPSLLLLDEPSLGLAPKITAQIFDLIEELRNDGLTVLLVEQKAHQTLRVADRAYLLETGKAVASGTSEELFNDPVLVETFLGGHSQSRDSGGTAPNEQARPVQQ